MSDLYYDTNHDSSRFVSYIREHPLIHRRTNTEQSVRNNSNNEKRHERFPEHETEEVCDQKCSHNSRSHIYNRDIKDPIRMRTFSRAAKYIFVTA